MNRRNCFAGVLVALSGTARAQPAPDASPPAVVEPPPAAPTPTPPPPPTPTPASTTPATDVAAPPTADPSPKITVGGYLEANYQLHVQNPSNRITSLRGFDNRSRTFTLSNVALDVKAETGPVTARVILQVGATPSSYYLGEPALAGSAGVNATSSELWKFVQAANLTAKAPKEITIEAGLFPSPIGPEVIPIKDNWNWSRSNLFFGLPFYHTGVAASRPLGGGWTGKLHVYSGWNSVVDNNGTPSVALSAAYAKGSTLAQVLYFGGNERATGAPEGKPWRHLFDAYVQLPVTDDFTVLAQADAGVEPNDFGTSSWVAGALYGKLALSPKLNAAVRGDVFYEKVASNAMGTASAIFWPTEWIGSGTATLAYQPVAGVSVRCEYRHDQAKSDVFYGGDVEGDGVTVPFVFNRKSQDTLTIGATAWF